MFASRHRLPLALALIVAGCAKPAQPPARLPLGLPAPNATLPTPRASLPTPRVARKPPTPPSRPARPAAAKPDLAGAAQARAAALAALSRGDATTARTLLRRAAALDPTNPLIRRDLARVENAAPRPR